MRFRHTANAVTVQRGSPLAQQMAAGLSEGQNLHEGHVALVFGGYNTLSEEFGGRDLEVRLAGGHASIVRCSTACWASLDESCSISECPHGNLLFLAIGGSRHIPFQRRLPRVLKGSHSIAVGLHAGVVHVRGVCSPLRHAGC